MKVVILAGGFGTRFSEESHLKPKPMIEIGEKPILWHIMKMYSYYGYNEFVICCGYKQHVIKEWFADYYLHNSDITFDFRNGENQMIVHNTDINIPELVDFHRKNGKMVTITTVMPGGRFGILDMQEDGSIKSFKEKKKEDGGWINAGFMVLEPELLDLIEGDDTVLERYPLAEAARRGQMDGYKHKGFWQCMDTLREKQILEKMWESGNAPWKIWD